MGIRIELITLIQEYNKAHNGAEPSKLYLTRADERALATMSLDEAGGPVSGNVREDYKTFLGIVVIWDSAVRYCE